MEEAQESYRIAPEQVKATPKDTNLPLLFYIPTHKLQPYHNAPD